MGVTVRTVPNSIVRIYANQCEVDNCDLIAFISFCDDRERNCVQPYIVMMQAAGTMSSLVVVRPPEDSGVIQHHPTTTSSSSCTKLHKPGSIRWIVGMMIASLFSMVYFMAPIYMISAILFLVRYYNSLWTWIYIAPIIVSAMIPSTPMPWVLRHLLTPVLDYFDYEEIMESSNVVTNILSKKKNYMFVMQPHGALSYTSMAWAIRGTVPAFQGQLRTAVADAVLFTPILKHVLGIFGLISASKQSLQRTMRRDGVAGSVILYVGGMAELFLSSNQEEKLYLRNRKGFIKLALSEGVDIVPVYLFGNTTTLSVLKTEIQTSLSRKTGVSLTYIWGKFYLPIPRDCKLLYVSGQPLGMPKIDNPTQADIDQWHCKYCAEVTRIFNSYKERVPEYKHKSLQIV